MVIVFLEFFNKESLSTDGTYFICLEKSLMKKKKTFYKETGSKLNTVYGAIKNEYPDIFQK